MPLIAIDQGALLNIAQQLEARCDPAFIAQEVRTLVTNAKPAISPEVVADLVQEVRSFGQCRIPIHAEKCECRRCRLLAAFPAPNKPSEKP